MLIKLLMFQIGLFIPKPDCRCQAEKRLSVRFAKGIAETTAETFRLNNDAVSYKKYACILFLETSGDTSRAGSPFGRDSA